MDRAGITAKNEKILLALAGCFFCVLLSLLGWNWVHRSAPGITVTTEREIAVASELPKEVDLNTADMEELAALPGIGEVLAQRIIEDRAVNGPYQSVDELTRVSGIGKGKLADLRDSAVVSGKAES